MSDMSHHRQGEHVVHYYVGLTYIDTECNPFTHMYNKNTSEIFQKV